jgi:hypothetical protein
MNNLVITVKVLNDVENQYSLENHPLEYCDRAAPTFVVVNKMSSASLTGRIDSTILSSALPSSICSVVQLDVDRPDKVISPTKIINDISREVQNELTPPKVSSTNRVADIVAS